MDNRDIYLFVKELDMNNAINDIAIALDLIRNAYRRCGSDLNIHQINKLEDLALEHKTEVTKLWLALGSAKDKAHVIDYKED